MNITDDAIFHNILACFIRDCTKKVKHDDMVIDFNTKNLNDYFGAKITTTCGNTTMDVCEVSFSNSNDKRNETCILTNATSDHGSVTVNNGAKYASCKVQMGFYKGVHCVQGDSDHQEIVEAVDGGWYE
jgi:glutamate 5-kinase